MITNAIDAKEVLDVMVLEVPNSFIQTNKKHKEKGER